MKLKITKKKIIFGIAVIAVAAFGVVKFKGNENTQPQAMPVSVIPLEKKSIEQTLSLKAPLEGTESVDVVSRLHYEVLEIKVNEGEKVTKGQLLAVLNKESLEKEIQNSRDNIELLRVRLSELQNNANDSVIQAQKALDERLKTQQDAYEKAVDDYNELKRQYDNVYTLFEAGVETQENVTLKKVALDEAQRNIDSYNTVDNKVVPEESELLAIENLKFKDATSQQREIANAEKLLQQKIEDLDECEIKSTIDGTVTRVYTKVGRFADETSDTNNPMFVIENIDKLKMKVNVSEYDIAKIAVGQKVSITADLLKGKSVEGVVSKISPTGEEKAGSSERVIPVEIDVLENDTSLIAGINAKATIEIARSDDTYVVPIEAVTQTPDGRTIIYRVNSENIIEAVDVETGVENDFSVEIRGESLNDGDNIISFPDVNTVEGTLVTII